MAVNKRFGLVNIGEISAANFGYDIELAEQPAIVVAWLIITVIVIVVVDAVVIIGGDVAVWQTK